MWRQNLTPDFLIAEVPNQQPVEAVVVRNARSATIVNMETRSLPGAQVRPTSAFCYSTQLYQM